MLRMQDGSQNSNAESHRAATPSSYSRLEPQAARLCLTLLLLFSILSRRTFLSKVLSFTFLIILVCQRIWVNSEPAMTMTLYNPMYGSRDII